MPQKLIDMTGEKYGYLTVIGISELREGTHRKWKCKCECGNEVFVTRKKLIREETKSCGCMKKQLISDANTIHSGKGTRLYRIWTGMKDRALNPNGKCWEEYGARGISICEEWLDFENFKNWSLQNGYKEDLTIDRIDNNKGYSPGNCRWTDWITQENNKRNTVYCIYEGNTIPVSILAKSLNITRHQCIKKYGR